MSRAAFGFVAALWCCSSALAQPGQPPASPTIHLVQHISTGQFGAETVRIGDLNADGAPDLLFVQSEYGTRAITCLTATTILGDVLWQCGDPSKANGRIYSDLPVQIYDWDADGWNDVLFVRQAKYVEPPYAGGPRERATRYEGNATMVVLNGQSGQEKSSFSLPAPADDCFLFADLTGRGRRLDLVAKDRYWNVWGIAHDGKVLWQWSGSPGHFPAVADVDEDGRDEVFVGFALLDHDGTVVFSNDPGDAHQDACWALRPQDGRWRLLFGNGGIHCLAIDGTEFWHHPLREAQHVVAGRFRQGSEVQLAVIDRTPEPSHRRDANAWAILYLYDLQGKEIWQRRQEQGAWAIATLPVKWFGDRRELGIFVYGHGQGRPAAIYDGSGNIVETLPMVYDAEASESERTSDFYGLVADVWGDSREEVILFNAHGACIYANARPNELPSLYNETLYPGH